MKKIKKVLITTVPFGEVDRAPLDMLESHKIKYLINPLNKKLTEDELLSLVSDFDVIIAGTENISSKVMDKAKNLKMISVFGFEHPFLKKMPQNMFVCTQFFHKKVDFVLK